MKRKILELDETKMEKRKSQLERPCVLGEELYRYLLGLCGKCNTELLKYYDARICYDCAKDNDLICRECNVFMLPSELEKHQYSDGMWYSVYCKECCKTKDFTTPPYCKYIVPSAEKEERFAIDPYYYRRNFKSRPGGKIVRTDRWVDIIREKKATPYHMFIADIKVSRKKEIDELRVDYRGSKMNTIYSKWYKELKLNNPEQVKIYETQAEERNTKCGITSTASIWESTLNKIEPV